MRAFLEHLLVGPSGLATEGRPVNFGSGDRLLFGLPANILSDGDGLRMCWDWRGASSMKPCWKHMNVLKRGSDLVGRRAGFVEITCTDRSQFRSWSTSQLYSAVDSLADASRRMTAGELQRSVYQDIEISVGMNFNRNGLLMSSSLRHSMHQLVGRRDSQMGYLHVGRSD